MLGGIPRRKPSLRKIANYEIEAQPALNMMKRKAEKQQAAGRISRRPQSLSSHHSADTYNDFFFLAPLSAVAARKARMQQTQTTVTTDTTTTHTEPVAEPPSKRPRRSLEEAQSQSTSEGQRTTRATKRGAVKAEKVQQRVENGAKETRSKRTTVEVEDRGSQTSSEEEEEEEEDVEENAAGVMAVPEGTEDG